MVREFSLLSVHSIKSKLVSLSVCVARLYKVYKKTHVDTLEVRLYLLNLSQRMTKLTIRLVRPAKTQISLRIRAAWSECTDRMCLLQPQGYPKRDKREPLPYWVMYRLIWVFDGHTGLIVGFVLRWLIYLKGKPTQSKVSPSPPLLLKRVYS